MALWAAGKGVVGRGGGCAGMPVVCRRSQVAAGGNSVLPDFDRVGDNKELKIRSSHRHQVCPSLLQEEAGAVCKPLLFHTEVPRLSRGKSTRQFLNLGDLRETFLHDTDKAVFLVSNVGSSIAH